eukprot:scaffold5987_cov203-Amphora_coffeaeformis.AAC.4
MEENGIEDDSKLSEAVQECWTMLVSPFLLALYSLSPPNVPAVAFPMLVRPRILTSGEATSVGQDAAAVPIPPLDMEHRTCTITSPGHETPLASGVSTNVSVDVDSRQHDSEADVDARQHDPEQDQDQPAFNHLWNNQYAVLTELDM